MWTKFKHVLPNSLFGRFLLIIILPMVLAQAVAAYMFYERHWSSVTRHMYTALAGDVAMVVKLMDGAATEDQQRLVGIASRSLYLDVRLNRDEILVPDESLLVSGILPALRKELERNLSYPFVLIPFVESEDAELKVQLPEGVLHFTLPRKRLLNPSTYIFNLWMMGSALILAIIAVWFMRNQVRSITRLAEAAESFGKGMEMPDFKPTGASEVRKAAQAFIDMKERIQRQISQRTEMLAGISHDLKTPITRVKLQLAMMKDTKEKEALEHDIQEMEHMVQEYLDFVRGQEGEQPEELALAEMLRGITAKYREDHQRLDVQVQTGLKLWLYPNAFRRAIGNILDNALRYGNMVRINAEIQGKYIRLTLDDDGPGIPPRKRELVFRPFYRIDTSRNLETGGTGLGLAITRDIILRHGGTIHLEDSPSGGLRVVIALPV